MYGDSKRSGLKSSIILDEMIHVLTPNRPSGAEPEKKKKKKKTCGAIACWCEIHGIRCGIRRSSKTSSKKKTDNNRGTQQNLVLDSSTPVFFQRVAPLKNDGCERRDNFLLGMAATLNFKGVYKIHILRMRKSLPPLGPVHFL